MSITLDLILNLAEKVLQGKDVTPEEARLLIDIEPETDIHMLIACANRIRSAFHGNRIELCAIVNAKSGKCTENCAFCAQSSRFRTGVDSYPMISFEHIIEAAQRAVDAGAFRFSIVTSGKSILGEPDMERVIPAIEELSKQGIRTCASLGLLTEQTAKALHEAGLKRYHHNLENISKSLRKHLYEP